MYNLFLLKLRLLNVKTTFGLLYPEIKSVPYFKKVVSINIFNYNLPPPKSFDYFYVEQSWHEIILGTPSDKKSYFIRYTFSI